MQDDLATVPRPRHQVPWNKGKITGAKPPLRPKHVWSIRSKVQLEGRKHDLALFNVAIDSKLRGCDAVRLKVDDVAPHGHTVDCATVRQQKTGRPVRLEMTEQTCDAVDGYLQLANKKSGEYLFANRGDRGRHLTPR